MGSAGQSQMEPCSNCGAEDWRVEEFVEIAFSRSRDVFMNEAHNGRFRCTRTEEIAARIGWLRGLGT